jgi:hypothetical protein
MDAIVALGGLRGRTHLHLLAPVVVVLLGLGVVNALAERGAGICLSRTSERDATPGRNMQRQCIADRLSADVAGQPGLALHLIGNCQRDRKVAMMVSRHQLARAPTEQARPTCLVTSRSQS